VQRIMAKATKSRASIQSYISTKRLGVQQINAINEKIIQLFHNNANLYDNKNDDPPTPPIVVTEWSSMPLTAATESVEKTLSACPQDISYPTDLNLLNDSREKAEDLIDFLYNA